MHMTCSNLFVDGPLSLRGEYRTCYAHVARHLAEQHITLHVSQARAETEYLSTHS